MKNSAEYVHRDIRKTVCVNSNRGTASIGSLTFASSAAKAAKGQPSIAPPCNEQIWHRRAADRLRQGKNRLNDAGSLTATGRLDRPQDSARTSFAGQGHRRPCV
jgi:hypothetical protein